MIVQAPDERRFRRRRWRSRGRRVLPYVIGLAVFGIAGGLVWLLLVSSVLGVHDIRVEGVATMDAERVREQAGVTAGAPLATLDTDEIAERLERLPRVAVATVHRDWPQGVTLEIRERTTVAVVADGDGYRGIDGEGVDYRGYASRPDGVPTITVDGTGAGHNRSEVLGEAAAVIDSLDGPIGDRVTRVEVASIDSIELVLRNGDRVRWGSSDDSDRKRQVLRALLETPAAVYDVTAPAHPATAPS